MNRPRPIQSTKTAFTLVELVAVLVLVGILSATAIPTLTGMQAPRGGMAARLLQRELTYARHRAIATGTTTWVVFDAAQETWTLRTDDPDDPGFDGSSILTDPGTGHLWTIELGSGSLRGVSIASADFDTTDTVGFDWVGRPIVRTGVDLVSGVVVLSTGHILTVVADTGHVLFTEP